MRTPASDLHAARLVIAVIRFLMSRRSSNSLGPVSMLRGLVVPDARALRHFLSCTVVGPLDAHELVVTLIYSVSFETE